MEEYKIKHRKSTPYHPQENGQVESTNKVIEAILTKTVHLHRRIGQKSFQKLYGHTVPHGEILQDILPMNLFMGSKSYFLLSSKIKTFKTTVKLGLDLSEAQKQRMDN
jgi:hypothetical protein